MNRTTLLNVLSLFSAASLSLSHGQTVVADAAADYVAAAGSETAILTTPPDGWSYFVSSEATAGDEVALASGAVGREGEEGFGSGGSARTAAVLGTNTSEGEYELFGNGDLNESVVGTDLLMHPSSTDETDFVIARYTVSAADIASGTTASITGSFREMVVPANINDNNRGSVDVFVFHNSDPLFEFESADDGNSVLTRADGSFNVETTVAAGDTISFAVGSNGNFGGDETALEAKITLQGGAAPAEPFRLFIKSDINSTELELSWTEVVGNSYNLRSSTSLGADPLTWEIVEGGAGLSFSASPLTIPRPENPRTFYVLEAFEGD